MHAKEWDAFILQHNGSFLQSWAWGEFQAAYGRAVERIRTPTGAAQCIVHALPFGKSYLFSPYGPVGDETTVAVNIQQMAQKHNAIFWRYERGGEKVGGTLAHEIHPQHNWVLQLTAPDTLLAQMKPKWRYNIRLAEKKGVRVHVSQDPRDIDQLYPLLQTTANRQHIRLHPKKYYTLMLEKLEKNNQAKLYLAEYNNSMIAGNIMMSFGTRMTYLHGGTDYTYHAVMAPHLLQWQAILDAHQAGFTSYDFFGIAPPNEPNHPWAGITRFKQGFGGERMSYPGTYELALQPMWYTMYTLYGYCHRRRR